MIFQAFLARSKIAGDSRQRYPPLDRGEVSHLAAGPIAMINPKMGLSVHPGDVQSGSLLVLAFCGCARAP